VSPDAIARAVVYAIEQPADVDVGEHQTTERERSALPHCAA